jgi:uncharacterized membrane protein
MLFWRPFTAIEEKDIQDAIAEAERPTTGEIRIRVDKYCKGDPALKASNLFHHLGMDQTKTRNGVLIYVSIKDHKFYIIGDDKVDQAVGQDFWDAVAERMKASFKSGKIAQGICIGIEEVGHKLAELFPANGDSDNQLPNTISYGR